MNKYFIFLLLFFVYSCTYEKLNPRIFNLVPVVINGYQTIGTIQNVKVPYCKNDEYDLGISFVDSMHKKFHGIGLFYKKFVGPRPLHFAYTFTSVKRLTRCENMDIEPCSFSPCFAGGAFYLEDDVASTKYNLDTTKINELNIIYQTDREIKASLRLTMIKYFGPGLDTIKVEVPEFTAKLWWPDE